MKHYDLSLLTVQYYDLSQILLIVPDPACVFIFDQYSQRTEVWPRPPPSIIGISDFLIVLNARYKFKFPSILQFQIALYSIIQDGYWTNLILLVSLIVCSSSEFVELLKCSKKTTTDNVITLSLKFHGNLLVKHKNNVPSKFPSLRKKMSNWEKI